ncbi:sodium-dependent phosphate transporter 2-like [Bradysia coprophila]|uniref:sodium-dependent phosphate transporter 2-like n=1 Tax=Bradysia coprophila TaxID=38358 RepID=UPI00187DC751|nr:sodium-dependent phosphate transporter 2-like [Bradysia coprophila]
MDPYSTELLWMVIVGFILAFFLAFAIGANDVANSFGTSVGSGVLTFKQAVILAAIFETAGSVLIGYKVTDAIRKGVVDVSVYEGSENVLVLGMLSSLIGSTIWIFIATFANAPVSTTHSLVGGIVGFSLVARGGDGMNITQLINIVISWFVSPALSGVVAIAIYTLIKFLILRASNPLKAGLISLPIIYGLSFFINFLAITFGGSQLLGMSNLTTWMCFVISIGVALAVALIVQFAMVPWQRKKALGVLDANDKATIQAHTQYQINTALSLENGKIDQGLQSKDVEVAVIDNTNHSTPNGSTVALDASLVEEKSAIVETLFHYLQILSAIFTAFAHGGNDVSNSIGPLITIWMVYVEGSATQKSESPIYLLFYGGIGMVIGFALLGRRINETIGKKITKIVPSTGFTIETSAAATVLLASKIGVPVSTTHCIVGAVVSLGIVHGQTEGGGKQVNWRLALSMFSAWVITLPVAGGISALVMYFFKLGFGF